MKGKVLIGLSGGVDSSVSALLLKEQGYHVTGLFMKNWEDDDGSPYCSIKEDFIDAAFIADQVGIDLIQENFAIEYKRNVFNYFLQELLEGRTPNPDILCNKEIKFKEFYNFALKNNYDLIATGHYARVGLNNSTLLKGKDLNKDQTYFLHSINPNVLKSTIFPIGDLLKKEVRKIAEKNNLITSNKKDSTGICFIGERPFPEFVSSYIKGNIGPILDDKGNLIGEHRGLPFYTLGQRQGLGIGGLKEKENQPWYVAKKDMQNNTLVAVQGNQHPLLFNSCVETKNKYLINSNIDNNFSGYAKIRYRQEDQECEIKIKEDSIKVKFKEPQRAITPGQSLVIYRGEECLGGGEISIIS
tara:strand:- start:23098 stop:24168 length:1071 start_codon:yes stop_codon:yes gene_type:complete